LFTAEKHAVNNGCFFLHFRWVTQWTKVGSDQLLSAFILDDHFQSLVPVQLQWIIHSDHLVINQSEERKPAITCAEDIADVNTLYEKHASYEMPAFVT